MKNGDKKIVQLTWFEVWHAGLVGLTRQVDAMKKKRKIDKGEMDARGFRWEGHINGAIGEYATAKGLNVHWSPSVLPDMYLGDVAGTYQVKATTRVDGCLLVQKDDKEKFSFVLVTLDYDRDNAEATLVGWLEGSQAKQEKYLQQVDPARNIFRSAFFVPQKDLKPMDDLLLPGDFVNTDADGRIIDDDGRIIDDDPF